MKGTIRSGPKMEWVDDEFMADLLGQVPKVKNTNDDRDVTAEIKHLKCLLSKYNFITTDRQSFINDISDVLQKIKEISPNWHGISLDRIIYFLDIQKFCLISGYGGIGKSYFIFRFEEQLEMCGIPHLCIYGKFEKSLDNIDFDSIRLVAEESGFVFVIDALNEMDDAVQQDFLNRLETLSECRGLRIVVTYRTHRLAKEIVDDLEKLSSFEYLFPGVSYESALDIIIRKEVPNAYKYESLLYSNNALILQTLCAVLSENLVIDEEINGFSILTHILEAYFRKSLGIKYWGPTKQVVKWMYDNCRRDIPENILFQIVNNPAEFITAMKQYGFWEEGKWNGENRYSFTIETLSDYLFARYFIQEIQGKTEEEQVQIINQKKSTVLGIDEVLIVALFDYSRDYELIYRLLQKTELFDSFRIELPLYIRFDIQSIFNDSVREFLRKRRELADYFDESHDEDIFDYIPPQKTNQIFTPKRIVKMMVDELEKQNPGCFDDPTKTFADLYMKSGLYITEIVKRLFRSEGLKAAFPDEGERVRHILQHQVYGMAPTRIIYLIATNYILGFDESLKSETHNFVQADAAEAAKQGTLQALVDEAFG